MTFFGLFARSRSAPVARERLQVLLAHERAAIGKSDLVALLRDEILAVIGRHVSINPERVNVKMKRGKTVSTLEVDIQIPTSPRLLSGSPGGVTVTVD